MDIDPNVSINEIYEEWYVMTTDRETIAMSIFLTAEVWLCILDDSGPVFIHSDYTHTSGVEGDFCYHFNREDASIPVNTLCHFRPLDYLALDTTPIRQGHYCLMLEVMRQLDYE